MKLFFSLLLAALPALGNGVAIYHTFGESPRAIVKRFTDFHGIPSKLVEAYRVKSCPAREGGKRWKNKVVLCANKNGLEVLNSAPSIIESLKVFKKEEK